jgi:hypothetical protein
MLLPRIQLGSQPCKGCILTIRTQELWFYSLLYNIYTLSCRWKNYFFIVFWEWDSIINTCFFEFYYCSFASWCIFVHRENFPRE